VANDDARDWVAIRRAVARYVQHRAGRGDVADDIAQEVLARLMQLAETEQIGSIMALAFRMPPLRREVLVRRRLHQQGCREIADALSLTPKAVEKHITRGLADLRRAMTRAGVEIGELP